MYLLYSLEYALLGCRKSMYHTKSTFHSNTCFRRCTYELPIHLFSLFTQEASTMDIAQQTNNRNNGYDGGILVVAYSATALNDSIVRSR
jgi:hypothetical protein